MNRKIDKVNVVYYWVQIANNKVKVEWCTIDEKIYRMLKACMNVVESYF